VGIGAVVAEEEDVGVDYARSITKLGVLVSVCLYCEHTMAAKAVSVLLMAERNHDCAEKQDAKRKSS
jgi:hypothetical protein